MEIKTEVLLSPPLLNQQAVRNAAAAAAQTNLADTVAALSDVGAAAKNKSKDGYVCPWISYWWCLMDYSKYGLTKTERH